MRNIIVLVFMTLSLAACIDTGDPVTNTVPPQPEGMGSHPNQEQQGNAFSISTKVFYQANLVSSNSPGQIIGLHLEPKGHAEMTTDFLDKRPIIIDTGSWTTLANGNLRLNLCRIGTHDSLMLEFKTDGNKLVYTGSDYGNAGFSMWVKHLAELK